MKISTSNRRPFGMTKLSPTLQSVWRKFGFFETRSKTFDSLNFSREGTYSVTTWYYMETWQTKANIVVQDSAHGIYINNSGFTRDKKKVWSPWRFEKSMPVLQVSKFDWSPVSPELCQRHSFQFIWFRLACSFDFVINVSSLSLILSKV